MRAMLRQFPWLEAALIIGLAVALIMRPKSPPTSSPVESRSALLQLKASIGPKGL